ncbi:hypothetical protein ABK040_014674 [Willaertia magna]
MSDDHHTLTSDSTEITNKALTRLQKNKANNRLSTVEPSTPKAKGVSFDDHNEDNTPKTRYPLPRQIRGVTILPHSHHHKHPDIISKLRKRRRRNRKIAACLRQVVSVLTNQILWFILLAIIGVLCVGTTVIISYVEGQRMGKSSQSSIASSILKPLQAVLNENSDWIEYFTESLTVGQIICNATKNFLLSQSYTTAKTKLLQNNPNFYSQTNIATISSNNAEKQFKLTSNETSKITSSFYRWANGYINTADQLRYLSHSGMELIKIENKVQNNKTVTLIQTTGLVDRSDTPAYQDYLRGSFNERTWFSFLDLKRGKTYSDIQIPYVQLVRSQKSILCELTESEWASFNMTLIKDRVTSVGTDGKQMLFAGYMIGTTNLNPFFSQLKEVVPENSKLRVMIINMLGQYYFDSKNSTKAFLHYIPKYQNISSSQSLFTMEDYDNSTLTQLLEGSRTKKYDPLWYQGRTLYYSDFSTDSETYLVIVEEQMQDVIYRGFYCIVDGLFVFFMFVNFVMIVFIFQRDKIEKLLNTATNLKTAMTDNQQQLIEQRNMYEIAYYSLIPESILMKNQNGLDPNYYEDVRDAVFVNLFMDFKVTQLQQCICQQVSTIPKDKSNTSFFIPHEIVKHKPLSSKRLIEYTSAVMEVLKEVCWFHGFNVVDASSSQLKCYRINASTSTGATGTRVQSPPTQAGNSSSLHEDQDATTEVDDNTESKSANSFASHHSGHSSSQTPTSIVSPSKSMRSLTAANLHWIIDTPYKCYEHIVSAMYLAFSIFYISHTYGLKFKDEDGDENCYAVIPFPKISIAMHIGDSDFTIIENGIPCLHVFGETTSKLRGMVRQEVICRKEAHEADCLLLSDVIFTKIQIISSIMNDRVRLVQKESENLKFQMEQKVFNLVAQLQNNLQELTPRHSTSSSTDGHQERLILSSKKDFMFHRLLIAETQKVFDEIKEKDSQRFNS